MPFFLEIPDANAHVALTRVDLPAPSFAHRDKDMARYYREYCWVLEGRVFEEKAGGEVIEIIHPQHTLISQYSPVSRQHYFEVEGPARIISIKEFVHLYNVSRAQRKLPPFQWDESVYEAIRLHDAYEAQKRQK